MPFSIYIKAKTELEQVTFRWRDFVKFWSQLAKQSWRQRETMTRWYWCKCLKHYKNVAIQWYISGTNYFGTGENQLIRIQIWHQWMSVCSWRSRHNCIVKILKTPESCRLFWLFIYVHFV